MRFLAENPQGGSDPEYRRRLMQFKAELKNSEDLENTMTYFENVNSGFLRRLREKHPELNSNDIRFLCYVYMQLNTKEIASLLNIAETSCKKRKQRIACKNGTLPMPASYMVIYQSYKIMSPFCLPVCLPKIPTKIF